MTAPDQVLAGAAVARETDRAATTRVGHRPPDPRATRRERPSTATDRPPDRSVASVRFAPNVAIAPLVTLDRLAVVLVQSAPPVPLAPP